MNQVLRFKHKREEVAHRSTCVHTCEARVSVVKHRVWDRLAPVSALVTIDYGTPAAWVRQRSSFVHSAIARVDAIRI